MRWIEQKLDKNWSSATSTRMATALITCATNAGLSSDKAGTRQLVYPQVQNEALTYWLYFLRHLAFSGSLLSNPYLASVGLSGRHLEQRINGLQDFSDQSIGDVYELELVAEPTMFLWFCCIQGRERTPVHYLSWKKYLPTEIIDLESTNNTIGNFINAN